MGHTDALPNVDGLPADKGLYTQAVYMLATIVEAQKEGNVRDITNHSERKYEPYFYAEEGYEPGSGSGGFSFSVTNSGGTYSCVGARLSSNSHVDARDIALEYPDLYEIFILNIK
ncbi:hypothetical protein [Arachidicoccus soli]|uniref:hypothetical protein n=1 Tax=Arachidicoccus soli TaxID=2341117 RepID=UPI0013C466B3|nr:hypothetical protein [Arachidicoccus soli]